MKLSWDEIGKRYYETGVDRGVLYVRDENGDYGEGVAWNGLTAVNEAPTGAEANPQYADNIKYLNLYSAEDFGATIEAFTYPDEFAECDGSASPVKGVHVAQQGRKNFGFSYRTMLGNDVQGTDLGYKIHVVFGASAAPSSKDRSTVNESPEALNFSWEITTIPEAVVGYDLKPTSHMTFNSKDLSPEQLQVLEETLYGGESDQATLPSPGELLDLMGAGTEEP